MDVMRSLMFVPGHRERMVEKALSLRLDVALLDLEDGVPAAEKENARRTLASALAAPRDGGPARYVRTSAVAAERVAADLDALLRPGLDGLDGLLLPKVERAEDVVAVARELERREPAAGLASGALGLIASIESARALLAAPAIAAASPRVVGLMFGAEDYALDLGIPTAREGEARDLLYARSAVVVAAAAARVRAFDGIWPDIHDTDGLRRDALQARRLGFGGKSLVHPGQIETINEVFSPTAEEVDYARRVLAAFEEAGARGRGAIALDGRLIDPPIVERARRILRTRDAIERELGRA